MITAIASTARSSVWLTPSVSSTYSCGRLASTAVMVMRPIRISSRMRSLVRKSSFSFSAAIVLPPFVWPQFGRFGARVRVKTASAERTVRIVGVDEVDPAKGDVSWISPIARALLKARAGDVVLLRTPAGEEALQILEVDYP